MHRTDSNLRSQKGWTPTLIIICIVGLLTITLFSYFQLQGIARKNDMQTFLNMGISILQQELNSTTKEYNSSADKAIASFLNSDNKLANRFSPWSKKKNLWTHKYSSKCKSASSRNNGQITLCPGKTKSTRNIFLVARDEAGNILDEVTLSADIILPTIPDFWPTHIYWTNEAGKNCDIHFYRKPMGKFEEDPRLTHCWLKSVKQGKPSSLLQGISHASGARNGYLHINHKILKHINRKGITTEEEYDTEFKKMTTERITQVLKNYTLLAFPDGTSLSDL